MNSANVMPEPALLPETRARILLLDNNSVLRSMIERVLSGDGYAVVSARNGEEALRHAGAGRIDLVLLDFGALMENPQEFARLLEVIERLLRESRCEG